MDIDIEELENLIKNQSMFLDTSDLQHYLDLIKI